jgi:hypothetical protein
MMKNHPNSAFRPYCHEVELRRKVRMTLVDCLSEASFLERRSLQVAKTCPKDRVTGPLPGKGSFIKTENFLSGRLRPLAGGSLGALSFDSFCLPSANVNLGHFMPSLFFLSRKNKTIPPSRMGVYCLWASKENEYFSQIRKNFQGTLDAVSLG